MTTKKPQKLNSTEISKVIMELKGRSNHSQPTNKPPKKVELTKLVETSNEWEWVTRWQK